MNLQDIKFVYFIGAGGIGMSALIRYFMSQGKKVAGYDRTPSPLTDRLIDEGVLLHFREDEMLIPDAYRDKDKTLVVYTPAVPSSHDELVYFRVRGFTILKRSQVLGLITDTMQGLCVAGTHGKTTTSSMLAHILKQSSEADCFAFLGGSLKSYNTTLMTSKYSDLVVVEADEYDRSFLYLNPYMAIITSADPDHLDIYGTPQAYRESFEKFTSLIRPGGILVMKKGIAVTPQLQPGVRFYTYSADDENADFYAKNAKNIHGDIYFDFIAPNIRLYSVRLSVPVRVNIENAVAAMAIAWLNGVEEIGLRNGIETFPGVQRRFDFQLKNEQVVFIDDYAHHPQELRSSILSVKELYGSRKVTGIFQPHLYTRTRDFTDEFAQALSLLDKLILLDIYPAREDPIPGVSSESIFEKVTLKDKILCKKEELLKILENEDIQVLLTLGAGDIDRLVEPIRLMLNKKYGDV